MEEILCDISAFQYHRIPPQVLFACPPILPASQDPHRSNLKRNPIASELLSLPIHVLQSSRNSCRHTKSTTSHLVTYEVPFGHIHETEIGVRVTSASYTLFQLAQTLSEDHLAMAMYEFCGTFSVFKPTPIIEAILADIEEGGMLPPSFGWSRVASHSGKPTNLWRREPIANLAELRKLAKHLEGKRGCVRFNNALERVTGIVASPFEAQTSLLFATSRWKGGEGMAQFVNNERIPLDKQASLIAGKSECYADLLFEPSRHVKPLIVECQSRMIHDDSTSFLSDSDRTMALQHMGFNVMPLTYKQIVDRQSFNVVARIVAEHLGQAYRPKTKNLIKKEIELRSNIFIDWTTLGN